MSYEPYAPNAQGLTEALLDLKSNFPGQVANKINGFAAEAFENLNQGDAVFSRLVMESLEKQLLMILMIKQEL
tara:strand:+ start:78 stop:296 length:219 start_codon:yes stop_codon:yes gene_type:complete